MRDIAIITDGKRPDIGLSFADSLYNNIYLSLYVRKGTFFVYPEFGSRLHEIKKVTELSIERARLFAVEATQWIVSAGKANSITVEVTRSESNPNGLNITVTATRKTGEPVTVTTWFAVIGSTKDWDNA
jgi:phage gp46-like protein